MRTSFLLVTATLMIAAPSPGRAQAVQQGDARLERADSLFLAGDYRSAATQYGALPATALDNRARYRFALALAKTGDNARAASILDALAPNGNPAVLFTAGSVHAALGHADTAFAYLDMAIGAGFLNGQSLSADSGFAKLRRDKRYAAAVQRLKDALTPCVTAPESHKFDFWVGEWNVFSALGPAAGSSSVQKILESCVLLENWTDLQGGQGKSFNAYNRALGQWQQFWVDQYGSVTEYRESKWVGASLQYTAHSTNAKGAPTLLHMTFTPIDANTVRQLGETSTDEGKTWSIDYDLTYRRKK